MSQKDALIKFVEKLEVLSRDDFTKEKIEDLEKGVQEFYKEVNTINRAKVQSNAMKILGSNISYITTDISTCDIFKNNFHKICQLSTEFFDESNDPIMLIAYLGIMSEYYLNKSISCEEQ